MASKPTLITPVILSGGQGTRLWPLSRRDEPKQFVPLLPSGSLFEATLERCKNPGLFTDPLIICARQHRFLVKKLAAPHLKNPRIIMEPAGRNTAAALCVAALAAQPDDLLLILPSDHYIPDNRSFCDALQKASLLAEDGHIVTFGITPTFAHTGYGYIRRGEPIKSGYKIKAFHEKPDAQTAANYLAAGDCYWNAGIFLARAGLLLEEIKTHAPDILQNVQAAWHARREDLDDTLLDPDLFDSVRAQSIDYALMEKTNRAAVMPTNFAWDDLGSWDAMARIGTPDCHQNIAHGPIYTHDVENAYLRSEGPALGVIGLSDIVAVAMPDAVFIAPKNRAEEARLLVDQMHRAGQSQVVENIETRRPWGSYTVMEDKPGFKVKKLSVDSGCRLSLQKHKHRSEHWVVVRGTATVTRGSEQFDVPVNESVYIPCGTVHRLENKGDEPLDIIEVQTGTYLGEDDIIRLEDDYQRIESKKQKAQSA